MQPTLPSSDNQVLYTLLFAGKTEVWAESLAPVTLAQAGIRTAPGETPVPTQELHQKGPS